MIRALLEATGAVWWACAAIVLAVVGIGLLRAFWRDWRASERTAPVTLGGPDACQNCQRPDGGVFYIVGGELHGLRVCYHCVVAITHLRLERGEVMG